MVLESLSGFKRISGGFEVFQALQWVSGAFQRISAAFQGLLRDFREVPVGLKGVSEDSQVS